MSFPTVNLSFLDVKNAFPALTNPIGMANFYNLGITSVPTSGRIGMNDLQGKTYASYILQQLSSTARTSCCGYYSLYRVSSTHFQPMFTVRRSSDNTSVDVYSNITGTMGLSSNGTGTSLSSWLNGSAAYISTWYDQSGSDRHATQANIASQPILDLANMRVNFRTNRFFNLPNGTVPIGNSSYTVSCRHGAIDSGAGGMLGSGTVYETLQVNAFRRMDGTYRQYWWGNDLDAGTYAIGNKCVWTYNGAQRQLTINGNIITTTNASYRNGTAINNKMGVTFTELGEYMNGDMYYMHIFSTALSTSDAALITY